MRRLLTKPGRTEIGSGGRFHDGDLIAAIDHLGDADFLEIVREAIVERLEPIDFAFEAIELGEALREIERFRFPFLDVRLEVFHLLSDGIAAGGELLDRVGAEELDQVFLLRDVVVQLDDLRMPRAQILRARCRVRP